MFGSPRRVTKKAAITAIVDTIGAMLDDPPAWKVRTGSYTNATKVVFLFFDNRNDIKWLRDSGLDLRREFPNSEPRDIQQGALPVQVARLRTMATGNQHNRCSAKAWFEALVFQAEKLHNGGNDAMFKLRGFLAGMMLMQEQRATLWEQGKYLRPILDIDGDSVKQEQEGEEVTAAL